MQRLPNKTRHTHSRFLWVAALSSLLFCLTGCDTAPVRVPGLSLSFPETAPGIRASVHTQDVLFIEEPKDIRAQHIGEDVAKTGWTACATDTLSAGQMPPLIQERITEALTQAGIFGTFATSSTGARWMLKSDVRAFCSQTRGFIARRAAGIVSIDFTLTRDGAVAWKGTVEHVVTDADIEYSGSFVTTVEQGMRRTMADALRLVLRDAVREIERSTADKAT